MNAPTAPAVPFATPPFRSQQLDDPVADDEAQAERGAVENGEPVEAPVAQDPGGHVELALGPRAATIRRRGDQHGEAGDADDERRPERGTPPEPAVQPRDDCEREPAAGEPHSAVEALREGRPAGFAHVRTAGDEAEAGADPDQRPGDDRERRLRRDERQAVERNRDDEPDERGAPRAEAIGGASSRNLHREMRDEERRREQPDDREAHVVGVGEL